MKVNLPPGSGNLVSSFYVDKSTLCTLYRDFNCAGRSLPASTDFKDLTSQRPEFGDVVKSIRCRKAEPRKSKFTEHLDQADSKYSTTEFTDRYCTRHADSLLAKFTQAKRELVKQGGDFAKSFDLSTDGCSVPGTFLEDNPTGRAELSFLPACERHGFCYRNFKGQNRLNIGERVVLDEIFQKEQVPSSRHNYSDAGRTVNPSPKRFSGLQVPARASGLIERAF
ncbi:hypothetical protein MY8738_000753 [Beauveria namnaoensis]